MIEIFVAPDEGGFRLMCRGPGMSAMPAGQRLFRAPPLPDIKFHHAIREAADTGANKLRTYLASLSPDKRKNSKHQA